MKVGDKQTLVCIGDSITDCGRTRPVGMKDGLGKGYVSMIDALLPACCPENHVRILNTGISGNQIIDLDARWKPDVLDLSPDWLSMLIGINDVWRHFDDPLRPDKVSPQCFEETYRKLLESTRPRLKGGLILATPFFLEPNRKDPMRAKMDEYGALVRNLAGEFDAVLVDLQAAFDRYLRNNPSQSLAGDRVHPNPGGHMIIATTFLTALGTDWNQLSNAQPST